MEQTAGALALAAALALGMSIPASAQKNDADRVSVPAVRAGAPVSPAGDDEPDKTETVTVKANPDGTTRKITVETVLKQQEGETLLDRTDLRNIRNTAGEESIPSPPMAPFCGTIWGRTFIIKAKAMHSFR